MSKPQNPISKFLKQIATPLTTAIFVVVAITGAMLFFHLGHSVKRIHEWLGMIFIVAALLHAFRNFAALKTVLKRRSFWVSALIVAIACVALYGVEHEGEHNRHRYNQAAPGQGIPAPAELSESAQ